MQSEEEGEVEEEEEGDGEEKEEGVSSLSVVRVHPHYPERN